MEIRAGAMGATAWRPRPGRVLPLEKIYEANLVPVVLGAKRTTHPELYDRLVAAGVTPEYYRPEAPPGGPRQAGMLVLFVGAVAAYYGVSWLVAAVVSFGPTDRRSDQSCG